MGIATNGSSPSRSNQHASHEASRKAVRPRMTLWAECQGRIQVDSFRADYGTFIYERYDVEHSADILDIWSIYHCMLCITHVAFSTSFPVHNLVSGPAMLKVTWRKQAL